MCERVSNSVWNTIFSLSLIVLAAPGALLAQPGNRDGARDKALPGAGSLPVAFIENRGQMDERVRFQARAGGMTAYFTDDSFVLQLAQRKSAEVVPSTSEGRRASFESRPDNAAITGANVFLSFEGASAGVVVGGIDPLPGHYNYFMGNDPSRWRTDVPGYKSIRYRNLYPGIDVVVRDHVGCLEYDLILEPGADLERVTVHCAGAEALSVNDQGMLIIRTAAGLIEQRKPLTYEILPSGDRLPVECSFRLLEDGRFGFCVPDHEARLPLVVDPGLVWSTFLGGLDYDGAAGMALDASDNVVLGGYTYGQGFPTTPGTYDTSFNGDVDAFIAKLDASGSTLLWSTFLGGSNYDSIGGLAIDASGSVTVTGGTNSSNFPTTPGAHDTTYNGGSGSGDAFVARLNASGSALVWSTFLGGSKADYGSAVALNASGAVLAGGWTGSSNFPVTSGAYDTTYNGGAADAYVTKLDASGSALVWSTFLGGTDLELLRKMAVDSLDEVFVCGYTESSDFPTTPGAYDTTFHGNRDAFVTKVNGNGSALGWSTLVGGAGFDEAYGMTLDASGNVVLVGYTEGQGFPTTPGAYDSILNGNEDAFITKVDANGSSLVWSTFLGGSGTDQAGGVLLEASNEVIVAGYTDSSDFPTTPDAYDSTYHGGSGDAFVAILDAGVSTLVWSTFLGGAKFDSTGGLALDGSNHLITQGGTYSPDFPVTPGAYDTTFGGVPYIDAFITKLAIPCPGASWANYGSGWPGTSGVPSFTASSAPVLCTSINLSIANSLGTTTTAALFVGLTQADLPTVFGGHLLLLPIMTTLLNLPGAGVGVPGALPCDSSLCGLSVYLQVLEIDTGASKGISFTPGLQLVLGS